MALTAELLQGHEALNGLTEEQINTIATLSANDEKVVIGKTFGQIHSELDESIKEITGVGKNQNEKTSDYMKRMLSGQKSSIEEMTTKISDLEVKVKDGITSEELKTQLQSKDATIADLQKKYQSKADEIKVLKEENDKALFGYRISNDLNAAMNGIEFSEGTNDAMKAFAIEKAMSIVKGYNPTYMKGADGRETLIFKDESGAEMRNPENALNLYTANDLLRNELVKLGVVSTETRGGGAGGKTPKSKPSLGGASTKAEALDMIEAMVKQRGINRHDPAFQKEVDKLYDDNYEFISTLR